MSTATDNTAAQVDVVVVLYHCDPALLGRCAESVLAASTRAAVRSRLVLVVNGGRVPTEVLPDGLPVAVLHSRGNVGYGGAVDVAVRASDAERVLVLNADAQLDPDALAALLAARCEHPEALLGGWMIRDGEVEVDSYVDWDFSVRRLLAHRRWRRGPALDQPFPVAKVSGGAVFADRALLAALGPFDEEFFMYCEDADLCRRARAAGRDLLAVPGARVLHEGSASESSFHAVVEAARADGAVRVTAAHRSRWVSLAQRAELTVVTLLGAALQRDPDRRRARLARLGSVRRWGLRREVPRFLGD